MIIVVLLLTVLAVVPCTADTTPLFCEDACGSQWIEPGEDGVLLCSCATDCVASGMCCSDMDTACPDEFAEAQALLPDTCANVDENNEIPIPEKISYADAGGSCRDHCGFALTDGTTVLCYCDQGCLLTGDCCPDFTEECEIDPCTVLLLAQGPETLLAQLVGSCGISDDGEIAIPVLISYAANDGLCAPGAGVNNCGMALADDESNPLCFCDSSCILTQDCCSDFVTACEIDECLIDVLKDLISPDTCRNQCGQAVPSVTLVKGYCYCDDGCVPNGDCCEDYADHCAVPEAYADPEKVYGDGSCYRRCATESGDCGCDFQCLDYGDCCEDFFLECSATMSTVDTVGLGSCEGNCGGSAWDCFCDEKCLHGNDCCEDFIAECSSTDLPDAPSCVDHCGEYSGAGCWCDAKSSSFGDGCADYAYAC